MPCNRKLYCQANMLKFKGEKCVSGAPGSRNSYTVLNRLKLVDCEEKRTMGYGHVTGWMFIGAASEQQGVGTTRCSFSEMI